MGNAAIVVAQKMEGDFRLAHLGMSFFDVIDLTGLSGMNARVSRVLSSFPSPQSV